MSIKQELERALVTQDWEVIRKVYKDLFPTSEPPAVIKTNADETEKVDLESLSCLVIDMARDLFDDLLISLEVELSPDKLKEGLDFLERENASLEEPEKGILRDTVNPILKTMDNYSELNDPELEDATKALNKKAKNKKRVTRAPYVPIMKACDGCRREFNYSKEYPRGHYSKAVLCHECIKKNSPVQKQ